MAAAGLHRLSFALSLHRQVLLQGMARLQPATHRFTPWMPRMRFHVRAGATKGNAADDFLAKVHDSDLVKTAGFVNGQWVAAEDGSTIEASPTRGNSRCHVLRKIAHATCNQQLVCKIQYTLHKALLLWSALHLLQTCQKPYSSKDGLQATLTMKSYIAWNCLSGQQSSNRRGHCQRGMHEGGRHQVCYCGSSCCISILEKQDCQRTGRCAQTVGATRLLPLIESSNYETGQSIT